MYIRTSKIVGTANSIIDCRHGKQHDYDIVIGAMANDQIYNFIADYMDGIITRDQVWVLARFKYPTHQINFCTDAALNCLEFVLSEEYLYERTGRLQRKRSIFHLQSD